MGRTEPKAESKGARGKVEGEPHSLLITGSKEKKPCWGGQEAMNSSVKRKKRPGRRQRDVLRGRERKTGRKQSPFRTRRANHAPSEHLGVFKFPTEASLCRTAAF